MQRLTVHSWAEMEPYRRLSTPIWVFDVDRYRIWWANPAAVEFWQASSLDELTARDFGSDSPTVRRRLQDILAFAEADRPRRDTWTLFPAGEPRSVLADFSPVVIEGGRDGIFIELCWVFDQTAEHLAHQTDRRLLEVVRATEFILSSFTLDGRLLTQNPGAYACYGNALERSVTAFADRFADRQVADQIVAALDRGEDLDVEVAVTTRSGQRLHKIKARRGRDPATGDAAIHLIEEDVTEQAELRESLQSRLDEGVRRLKESDARYTLAAKTAWIWDWDIANSGFFVAPDVIEALGYEPKAFYDVAAEGAFLKFVHPDDRPEFREQVVAHLKDPAITLSSEFRFLTANGDLRWLQLRGRSVHDRAGRAVRSGGILTDVTERKQIEASLMAAQRLEAIGRLSGGIAHDFNNLLTVIQGNAQLLQEAHGAEPELTGAIVDAVDRGAELTRHLLAYSRKQTLSPQRVSVPDLFRSLKNTVFRTIGEHLTVHLDVPATVWDIHVDPTQLEAALLNLAINARDALPGGGEVTFRCRNRANAADRVTLETEGAGGREFVEITVSDTGAGMTAHELEHAFEPFFSTKGVGKGSGLGLAMVYGFSRQSGGDAYIRSFPGKGTTVGLLLPRDRGAVVEQPAAQHVADKAEPASKIHVLEDNDQVRLTIMRMLMGLGYDVTGSGDAKEALDVLEQGLQPDVILTDIVLPGGMSGIEFARQVVTGQTDAKIVLMSGYPDGQMDDSDADDLGLFLLEKPFSRATLAAALTNALEN